LAGTAIASPPGGSPRRVPAPPAENPAPVDSRRHRATGARDAFRSVCETTP